jgi:uncharacterized protein YqhQ
VVNVVDGWGCDDDERPTTEEEAVADLKIGGMALRDGVLLQSPDHWAAAVRLPDGSLRVRSGRKPLLPGHDSLGRVPVVRGIARLAESMTVLAPARRSLGRPVLPQEDPAILAATVGSATLGTIVRRRTKSSPLAGELAVAALTLLPALLALRRSELSRFHGAEHKSVAAYESGDDVHGASKEHVRCGSNLIGPLLVTNLAGGLLLRGLRGQRNPLATLAVGLVGVGSAVEIFSWMARHRDHPLARMLLAPGVQVQQIFTTREPSERQLDVAQAALEELLRLEGTTGAAGEAPAAPSS